MTPEKQAELLMDHYKETVQQTGQHWKARNRLFSFVLVALTLMLFQLTSPNVLERLANSYVRKQTESATPSEGVNKPALTKPMPLESSSPNENISSVAVQQEVQKDLIDFRFITSLLWFLLTYLLVQYYQRSILVDRQFIYLKRLEGQISDLMGKDPDGNDYITREGKFYAQNRPTYLNKVGSLYQRVFLLLLTLVIVAKVIQEWMLIREDWAGANRKAVVAMILFAVTDTGIAAVIGYYTILYRQWLRPKPKSRDA